MDHRHRGRLHPSWPTLVSVSVTHWLLCPDGKRVPEDEDWNDKIACALAENEGVDELTKERLDIIRFMRDYYKKYNFFPIPRAVCKNTS